MSLIWWFIPLKFAEYSQNLGESGMPRHIFWNKISPRYRIPKYGTMMYDVHITVNDDGEEMREDEAAAQQKKEHDRKIDAKTRPQPPKTDIKWMYASVNQSDYGIANVGRCHQLRSSLG